MSTLSRILSRRGLRAQFINGDGSTDDEYLVTTFAGHEVGCLQFAGGECIACLFEGEGETFSIRYPSQSRLTAEDAARDLIASLS